MEVKPELAAAQSNLGIALLLQGRIGDAKLHLERAIALNPDLFEAHLNLGRALSLEHDRLRPQPITGRLPPAPIPKSAARPRKVSKISACNNTPAHVGTGSLDCRKLEPPPLWRSVRHETIFMQFRTK